LHESVYPDIESEIKDLHGRANEIVALVSSFRQQMARTQVESDAISKFDSEFKNLTESLNNRLTLIKSEKESTALNIASLETEITKLQERIDGKKSKILDKTKRMLDEATNTQEKATLQNQMNELNNEISRLRLEKKEKSEQIERSRIGNQVFTKMANQGQKCLQEIKKASADIDCIISKKEAIKRYSELYTKPKPLAYKGGFECGSDGPEECIKKLVSFIKEKAKNDGSVHFEEAIKKIEGQKKVKDIVVQTSTIIVPEPIQKRLTQTRSNKGWGFDYEYNITVKAELPQGFIDKIADIGCKPETDVYRIIGSYPEPNAENVDIKSEILVIFNRPLPLGKYDFYERRDLVKLLHRGEEVKGKVDVLGNRIVFKPNTDLEWNTYYQVVLSRDIVIMLSEPFQLGFRTTLPNRPWDIPECDIRFVFIKGGCFSMGKNNAWINERPKHRVCLSDFYMSSTEITREQWFCAMRPEVKVRNRNNPIINISKLDVAKYIGNLSKLAFKHIPPGFALDLPSEAQWEYACKGGAGRNQMYGIDTNSIIKRANYGLEDGGVDKEDGYSFESSPVASYKSNCLGLYDMSGNVMEWIKDSYEPDAYRRHVVKDPVNIIGKKTGDSVVRGGSWFAGGKWLECTTRFYEQMETKVWDIGFRLVLNPK
jgi:formylglycine-generating enzyme